MPIPRKVVKIGGGRYVAIPPAWLGYHEKKSGRPIDELLMEINNVITLKVDDQQISSPDAQKEESNK
jgi:hypothetical protein